MSEYPDRKAGIFVPLFALRGKGDQGIGDTRALKEMISWCSEHSVRVLQILPINETSADNSPYNAVSSLALEPTTLSLRAEDVPGLDDTVVRQVIEDNPLAEGCEETVMYPVIRARIRQAMETALKTIDEGERAEFYLYRENEKTWLNPYTRFRALMEWNEQSPVWTEWPESQRTPESVDGWLAGLDADERQAFYYWMEYFAFCQWVLHRQWEDVRNFAEANKVDLMGDIPFGVSRYSADVWAHPDWFELRWSGGAPPEPMFQDDVFVKRWGQNWGIPPYNWDSMAESGFQWWRQRVHGVARYFHCFRIDHILGFYRLYCFPWLPWENDRFAEMEKEEVMAQAGALPRFFPESDETPEGEKINHQHGEKLLQVVLEAAGDSVVVGEDLGMVPDYVRPSLQKLGISGFKIPVFEKEDESGEYKSFDTYAPLSVTTLSTHDHMPIRSMWEEWLEAFRDKESQGLDEAGQREKEEKSWELYRTQRFLGLPDDQPFEAFEPAVREAWLEKMLESPSWLAIAMITDLYGLTVRFNVPGPISESNWSRRLPCTIADMNSANLAGIGRWFAEKIHKSNRTVD